MKFDITDNQLMAMTLASITLLLFCIFQAKHKENMARIEHGYVQVDGKWVKEK